MTLKPLLLSTALALAATPHAFAATDFSQYSTEDLTKLKVNEMSDEDRAAFREEIRSRAMNMSDSDRSALQNEMRAQRDNGQSQGMGGGGQGRGMGGGQGRRMGGGGY